MEKVNKRGIAMAGVIVALLLVAFMVLDYSLIWTKWSAIYYGKQLLVEEFVKPHGGHKWSKLLPLDAEKTDGVWRVYDTLCMPDGTVLEGYYVTFTKRNTLIEIGLNE